MPTQYRETRWRVLRVFALVLLLFSLIALLLWYIFLSNKIKNPAASSPTVNMKTEDFIVTTISTFEEPKILKHKYPLEREMPEFVNRYMANVPKGSNVEFDLIEGYDVRVVSTGNTSTSEIKDVWDTGAPLKAVLLEVYLDDKEGYVTKNDPFNIALKVHSNSSQAVMYPLLLLDIFMEERPEENLDIVGIAEQYDLITEEEIKKLFPKDSVWMIRPYLRDATTKFEPSSIDKDGDGRSGSVFFNQYYGGEDSRLIEKIIQKDIASLKEPVLITRIYK